MSSASSSSSSSSGRAQTTYHPKLTPQFCFSTSALKEFLRLSRSTIDDSISQNINALNTPSRPVFSPTSTSARNVSYLRHRIPASSCEAFVNGVLFTSWQSRSDVLNYCASVATSDDPDDPDTLTRLAESDKARERVVDERLDPYSGRWMPKESRTEVLAGTVRNERMVEEIVRERSWRIVGERCEEVEGAEWGGGKSWREALERWSEVKEREGKRL